MPVAVPKALPVKVPLAVALAALLIVPALAVAGGPRTGPYYAISTAEQPGYGIRGNLFKHDGSLMFKADVIANKCPESTSFAAKLVKRPSGKLGFKASGDGWLIKGAWVSRTGVKGVVDGPGGCPRERFKGGRVGSDDDPRSGGDGPRAHAFLQTRR